MNITVATLLDGEVWRGVRAVAVLYRDRSGSDPSNLAWLWVPMSHGWASPAAEMCAMIFAAWAQHERACADKARREVERLRGAVLADMSHAYEGRCPEYDGDPQRDPDCKVCRILGTPQT